MKPGIVVAGGGLAAQRCCEALRSQGYEGRIRVICEEPLAPYDRPPLSKAVLAGARDAQTLAFRSSEWYSEHAIELELGERAASLNPVTRTFTLASGGLVHYEHAVICTGSRPRTLAGLERYTNVHALRSVADAHRLAKDLRPGARLVIVGAGFIGLEVAATARGLGADAVILEAAPAPLMRVLGPELGIWFAELHRAEGAEVLLDTRIEGFGGKPDRVEQVQLAGGRRIDCTAVLVGIGIEADTLWLEGSGLDPDGVRVDPRGRTSAPDVYAAGDAARVFSPASGAYERTEHWEAAAYQGAQVARTILGEEPLAPALPSFWTDQYGLRIRTVGDTSQGDEYEFDGDPASRDYSVTMLREGVAVAGMAVGRPRAIPELRKRIQNANAKQKGTADAVRAPG